MLKGDQDLDPISVRGNRATSQVWAGMITNAWRTSIESIIECGRLLVEAKQALPHGEFQRMIKNELPFGARTAQRLMRIAADPRIANTTHGSLLPSCWRTLDELTRLSDEEFAAKLSNGTIHADMRREDVALWNRMAARRADEERVKSQVPVDRTFRSLLFDPSWPWTSFTRTAPDFAPQTLDEIAAMPVPQWADDLCHLWCWTTNRHLWDMPALIARWGFANPVPITWVKQPGLGLGSAGVRHTTEHLILATRGDLRLRLDIPSHFVAPRGRHSAKPEVAYELIRRASYGPTGEMGQRMARPGFSPLYVPNAVARQRSLREGLRKSASMAEATEAFRPACRGGEQGLR